MVGAQGAVSYSFGGRKTIRWFNNNVSKHGAPTYNQIENTTGTTPQYAIYRAYNGNIQDASTNETNPLIAQHGNVGSGTMKWPGLYQNEWTVWSNNSAMVRYAPWNWVGIDCNGLALQSLRYADRPEQYAVEQYLTNAGDRALAGVSVGRVCLTVACPASDKVSIHNNQAMRDVNVRRIFSANNTELFYYWARSGSAQDQYIHKGDFAKYGTKHISIVYSERYGESQHSGASYDIIHAYGSNQYQGSFSRKVIVTGNNIVDSHGNIINPAGFGRVRLWQ